jgi:hypothetical protein
MEPSWSKALAKPPKIGPDMHDDGRIVCTELGFRFLEVIANSLVQPRRCFTTTCLSCLKKLTGKFCAVTVNENRHESVLLLNPHQMMYKFGKASSWWIYDPPFEAGKFVLKVSCFFLIATAGTFLILEL